MAQELRAHMAVDQEAEELSAMPSCLSPFPHFIQYRTIAYGVVPPLLRVGLPLY